MPTQVQESSDEKGRGRTGSKVGHHGDDFLADGLEWWDPIDAWHEADHRLYAHAREPAQLPDQLVYLLASLADVEGESTGLLYGVVVRALFLTVSAQYVELPGYLGARAQTAGVGVALDHAQRLLLPVAGDHDRRVGPAHALRQVQWSPEPEVIPLERALVSALAAPHSQGYLDRLLEHLETLPLWRERYTEPQRLLFVVARADAEAGTTAREHIQRRNGLFQDGRGA